MIYLKPLPATWQIPWHFPILLSLKREHCLLYNLHTAYTPVFLCFSFCFVMCFDCCLQLLYSFRWMIPASLHSHLSTSIPGLDCPCGGTDPSLTSNILWSSVLPTPDLCFGVACIKFYYIAIGHASAYLSPNRSSDSHDIQIYNVYFFCILPRRALPLLVAYFKF